MESEESRRIAVALVHRAGNGADAAQIADTIVSTWQAIDVALTPIVGQLGVAMLYKRSLHLTGPIHPWLKGGSREDGQAVIDLAALKSVLAQQSSTSAATGGAVLLHTFHELLTSLVGPSLTERLLRPVWADFLSGPSAQDNSS